MPEVKDIKNTKNVIHLSSNGGSTCKFGCNELSQYSLIDEQINHYIEEHNYTLLKVGSESGSTPESVFTVALLGLIED